MKKATLNPSSKWRRLFPTTRRCLIERDLSRIAVMGQRVLVVGAGADPYRKIFSQAGFYVCLDIENQFGSVNTIGDAHKLPYTSQAFDTVVLIEVLEHLERPYEAISEISRVLAVGGCCVATVPFLYHIHGDPSDFHRFSPEGIKRLFVNFKEVRAFKQGTRFHVIIDLLLTGKIIRFPLFPLRAFTRILVWVTSHKNADSTAPSGFLILSIK